ncbi:alpha/beta hydrolase family protein [Nonomuraea aridisoli]|uniref:alpha/beta hydrolase family protein n=1 Tax=Nonomuraea aridisoli TaxID=2070368 RepID=UPI0015E8CBE9|nr:prolyl oligopeptidase family serine peptidase [Nonomuraea aridisoli]
MKKERSTAMRLATVCALSAAPGLRTPWRSRRHWPPARPAPLSAVVNYALNRTAVNGDRLALYGLSFGGYLAPRAAAHDRRIKALVANSPQRDLLGLVLDATTGGSYDDASERVRRASWSTQALIENYLLWNHGVTSLDAFLRHAANFSLEGMEEQIACPTLSLVAEGETQTALAQARRFHQALRAPKHFVTLTTADGADHHCGVSNVTHTSALAYDWIAQQLRQA